MSYQTKYNQPGWNDCFPTTFIKLPSKPITSSSSSLKSITSGIGSSTTALNGTNETDKLKSLDVGDAVLLDLVSKDIVQKKIDEILSKDSKLPTREYQHYSLRIKKLFNSIPENHYEIIYYSISNALDGNPAEGKNLLVQYMLVNNGIAGWAVPLRKIVENVIF